jgi:hypothetical protein
MITVMMYFAATPFIAENFNGRCMSVCSTISIERLVQNRRHESIRVHRQFTNAMEVRKGSSQRSKDLIKTILADLPEEREFISHNFD